MTQKHTKKKSLLLKKKKIIIVLLITINIFAVAFIGYRYIIHILPYRTWYSFENVTAGYTVKYPPDWYLHDNAYLSPYSTSKLKRSYPVTIQFWGFGVGHMNQQAFMDLVDQELRLVKSKNSEAIITIEPLVKNSKETIVRAVVQNFKDKAVAPLYEGNFNLEGGEWVLYWVSDGDASWRIDYIYPFQEKDTFMPIFEKILATFETGKNKHIWGPDIFAILDDSFLQSGAQSEEYFLKEPDAGFLVPQYGSFPAGFSLQSSLFTKEYSEYIYTHRRFGSRIEVSENKSEKYTDAVSVYATGDGQDMQYTKQEITVHDEVGTAIVWHNDAERANIISVTVLLNRGGYVLKVVRDAVPEESLTVRLVTEEIATFYKK
ncbi:MAG: hypothetical protein V1652_02355 [bacterium]